MKSIRTYILSILTFWMRREEYQVFLFFCPRNWKLFCSVRWYETFPSFWLWKGTCPPLSLFQIEPGSWNLINRPCKSNRRVYWGVSAFQPHCTLHSSKNVVFSRYFSFFEFVICTTPLKIELWSLNLIFKFIRDFKCVFC